MGCKNIVRNHKLKMLSHDISNMYHTFYPYIFKVDVSKFNHFFFRQQILLVRRDDHVCKCLLHPVFAISRHVREAPVPTERKPHNGATPSDRPLDKNTIVAAFPYVPGLYNHLSHSLHSGTTKTSCGPLLR